MESLGIKVSDRVPCVVRPTEFNEGYLSVKEKRMDHMLADTYSDAEGDLIGQFCYWNHEGEPSSSGVQLDSEVGLNGTIDAVAQAVSSGQIEPDPKSTRKSD